VARPGLAVVDVASADDATAFAIQEALAALWATAAADRATRDPVEPGVRLRCYLDAHLLNLNSWCGTSSKSA
jgi:Family of unknown function (DUF6207)